MDDERELCDPDGDARNAANRTDRERLRGLLLSLERMTPEELRAAIDELSRAALTDQEEADA